MPVITIYGIPEEASFLGPHLTDKLKQAASNIAELAIKPGYVTVLYPRQHHEVESESDIIAFVDIFDKPERTDEVRQRLAEAVRDTVMAYANNNSRCLRPEVLEVFVRPIRREDGFASARHESGSLAAED